MTAIASWFVNAVITGGVGLWMLTPAFAQSNQSAQDVRAQLQPQQYTTLAAEIGLKVSDLPFVESARFSKGDNLVTFDCSMQQALLNKAQAELDGARAIAKSNQRLARLNSVGELELVQSEANAQRAEAELGAQQAVVAKCSIQAPFDGRIAEQFVRPQQYVQPGEQLLEIIDDSILELVFLVPSRWLQQINLGDSLTVEIDETQKTYPAKFIRIGARVDPVSQSVKVVAAIDGTFPELMAGMSGRIVISQVER
jgi:membrane fusion protein (multidrug efflux system)